MNAKDRRNSKRAELGHAADVIRDEINLKKWDHVKDLHTRPVADCEEIISELENRCPGYTLEQYQMAIARSIFMNR